MLTRPVLSCPPPPVRPPSDVDKVDRIMDDIEDAMARKNEVTDAITRQLGPVYDEVGARRLSRQKRKGGRHRG